MTRRLVLALAVLLAGSGALAGYGLKGAADPARPPHPAVAASAPPVVPRYLDLPPLTVAVIRDGEVRRHVGLRVVAEVSAQPEGRAEDLRRRLGDSLLTALHHDLAGEAGDAPLDLPRLKRLLHRAAQHAAPEIEVLDILIQDTMDRRLR